MDKSGKSLYLKLNTTGLIKALFEAFENKDIGKYNPQYQPSEVTYDSGTIRDWKRGEELAVVGEPDKTHGTREVKFLVAGNDGETILENFMEICEKRRVEVYPF